jgi:outer membrane protein OmpA-like peptidoglycan-associated protein
VIVEEPDHRMIVRENGRAFIRHDEAERFRLFAPDARIERRGNLTYTIMPRPGGVEIITVTDADGRLVRRIRREPGRAEYVLIDNSRPITGPAAILDLPPPRIVIPRERYIVDISAAPQPLIFETLMAPPIAPIQRAYSLDEIRYNATLRDYMPRIDVDTINFELGSWEVTPDQAPTLELIAQAIGEVVARNPDEVFLIEGHTDATGNDVDNLSLSDRRAGSVAEILTETYQIPPENLVTQGYGSQYLKVPSQTAERVNRRVTLRRITPLLTGRVARR